jgi:hypothetical protein
MLPIWWAIGTAESTSRGTYNNAMPSETWGNLKERLPEQVSEGHTV